MVVGLEGEEAEREHREADMAGLGGFGSVPEVAGFPFCFFLQSDVIGTI